MRPFIVLPPAGTAVTRRPGRLRPALPLWPRLTYLSARSSETGFRSLRLNRPS